MLTKNSRFTFFKITTFSKKLLHDSHWLPHELRALYKDTNVVACDAALSPLSCTGTQHVRMRCEPDLCRRARVCTHLLLGARVVDEGFLVQLGLNVDALVLQQVLLPR